MCDTCKSSLSMCKGVDSKGITFMKLTANFKKYDNY